MQNPLARRPIRNLQLKTAPLFAATLIVVMLLGACAAPKEKRSKLPPQLTLDQIAEGYVKLVLAVGIHDPDYVDAYYGPAEWQEQALAQQQSLLAIRNVLARLYRDLPAAPDDGNTEPAMVELRKRFLRNQLAAMRTRIRILEGWDPGFDDESLSLYDISAPSYDREHFSPMLTAMDQLLPPGPGLLGERYSRYMAQFAVPADRLEVVMRTAIGEARERTMQHIALPQGERFELSFVSDKPWTAYNWYQGGYVSRIEINTDQPISINRAIVLASHEGYPGHHVYNVLTEQQLVKDRGWVEFQVYPLFSPQSFIAEGSADFGMDLAFPAEARLDLTRRLFELCGFDVSEVERYDAIVQAAKLTGEATIEGGRRYLEGQASREEALNWLETYALESPSRAEQRLAFFDKYGAYIINYAYGEQVVRAYVEQRSGSTEADGAQWQVFSRLLSEPRTPHRMSTGLD